MRNATKINPTEPPTTPARGGNGSHASYGNGHKAPKNEPDNAAAGRMDAVATLADPQRVEMNQARQQSSARRRPTRKVEAQYDPVRHGIDDVDPTGGAFETTQSMSGRTPPPSSGLPAPRPEPAPAHRVDPQVTGNAVQLARAGAGKGTAGPLNKHVCPFCGMKRDDPEAACSACGLYDNEGTRGATVARVGPWFVLQPRNPSAPGMRFSVLRELVRSGQVTAGSIVRGPATQQLWTYSARVRGLAHLFGVCWSCNRRLPATRLGEEPDDFCVYCGSMQTAPTNPDQQLEALGISENIGAGVSNLAGQVASSLPGPATSKVQFRETTPSLPQVARRLLPRPLPPAPRDGGDALLTTRELATAFNLDRKRSVLRTVGRIPWMKVLITLAVLAVAALGMWLAAKILLEPVTGLRFPG